jgi:hypothetical protein
VSTTPQNGPIKDITATVDRLRRTVDRVTIEEFRWQDGHYNQDSRYGRELLFLIANSNWIRATTETIDIDRSDAVDTTVKVDIDLDKITHEAFPTESGRVWLPLLVLPSSVPEEPRRNPHGLSRWRPRRRPAKAAPDSPGQPTNDGLDPFANLTVTDATGELLPAVPISDVRHWIAAGLAEIFVNLMVARWAGQEHDRPAGQEQDRPAATREQRLLLSAAIFRMLHVKVECHPGHDAKAAAKDAESVPAAREVAVGGNREQHFRPLRIHKAREALGKVLDSAAPHYQANHVLFQRAAEILDAFTRSDMIVVAVDRSRTPTVLTARALTRELRRTGKRALGRPRAELMIDLLIPSAEADRQIQLNLPDGVSVDKSERDKWDPAELTIGVQTPEPIRHRDQLKSRARSHEVVSKVVKECLDDLAMAKGDAATEALRHYQARSDNPQDADASGSEAPYLRRTSWRVLNPRTVVARAEKIDEVSYRAVPVDAKIKVRVDVTDAEFFSIARLSGLMSALLMFVVFAFFVLESRHPKLLGGSPSTEVLASALTLFSVIQAGRVEPPDTSTLRGMLSAMGNWLIIASILPTVLLAVALAFGLRGSLALGVTLGAIGLQGLLQLVMWVGPLSSASSPRHVTKRRLETRPRCVYKHNGVLQEAWWRSTTAEALMIGRRAHAYVVSDGDGRHLLELLGEARQADPRSTAEMPGHAGRLFASFSVATIADPAGPGTYVAEVDAEAVEPAMVTDLPPVATDRHWPDNEKPSNILALMRSATAKQALTFVVFREEPSSDWVEAMQAKRVQLDPDRLAPLETSPDVIEIFLAMPADADPPPIEHHPLTAVLAKAKNHHLIVLEAQLPVPAEDPYPNRRWARVRIALRDEEIAILPCFLKSIGDLRDLPPYCEVLVRTSPERPLRRISGTAPDDAEMVWQANLEGQGTDQIPLVSASAMDVVGARTRASADSEEQDAWRFLAVSAYASNGIDHALLTGLSEKAPKLRMARLTYAILFGTSAMFLLGYQCATEQRKRLVDDAHDDEASEDEADEDEASEDEADEDEASEDDAHGFGAACTRAGASTDAGARVLVDDWYTASELGKAAPEPILRMHLTTQDRPGILLDILLSLRNTLRDSLRSQRADPSRSNADQSSYTVWHALAKVTAGHSGEAQMTMRLPVSMEKASRWDREAKLEEIEQSTRRAAASAATSRREASLSGDVPGVPEDIVISLGLIEVPAHPHRET